MDGPNNVQLSSKLFSDIISFMEYLDAANYDFPLFKFKGMLAELRAKQHKINLRSSYCDFVLAQNGGQREAALNNYLQLKKRHR